VPETTDAVAAVGALADPRRRALYEAITDHGGWVSRDEAADLLGLERGTAAHHLDRLADDGLLDVDFQRRTGRQGPGAGRPAKLYRRAQRELEVSLPPRDYEMAGRLLADAADRSHRTGADIVAALEEVAADEGRRLAEGVRGRPVVDVLAEEGFEPATLDDGTVVLRNCPFHHLAQQHTELICGMNLCLLGAAVDAVAAEAYDVALEPEEGLCCVRLHPAG
jgi:predicted ArsR family transcriptional regulator